MVILDFNIKHKDKFFFKTKKYLNNFRIIKFFIYFCVLKELHKVYKVHKV